MHTPDGKPDAAIRCSRGGDTNPLSFYCTTYRSLHSPVSAVTNPREPVLNTQFHWSSTDQRYPLATAKRDSVLPTSLSPNSVPTGYVRNIGPCFAYDNDVDAHPAVTNDINPNSLAAQNCQASSGRKIEYEVSPTSKAASIALVHGNATRDEVNLDTTPYLHNVAVPGAFVSTMTASYTSPSGPHPQTHILTSRRASGFADTPQHAQSLSQNCGNERSNIDAALNSYESGWVRDRAHAIAHLTSPQGNSISPSRKFSPKSLHLAANDLQSPEFQQKVFCDCGETNCEKHLLSSDCPVSSPTAFKNTAYTRIAGGNILAHEALQKERANNLYPNATANLTVSTTRASNSPTMSTEHKKQLGNSSCRNHVSGAVRDAPNSEIITAMQKRTWDTSYSMSYDPERRPVGNGSSTNCDFQETNEKRLKTPQSSSPKIPVFGFLDSSPVNRASPSRSGYTMCNKFGFDPLRPTEIDMLNAQQSDAIVSAASIPGKSPKEVTWSKENEHARLQAFPASEMQRKMHRLEERSLYQNI